jgi:uncharacterized protein (DUF697 family)
MSYLTGRGADEAVAASHAAIPVAVPIFWLLGKVQSGKSSIVRAVTGCSDIEIGVGFKPCTATARLFEYPVDTPLIRFLDTRGLGEVNYEPAADIALAEGQANILLVVMNALDQQQRAVLDVVKTVRGRHPQWPLVVAQTTLHAGYARSAPHPMPYPFDTPDPVRWEAAGVPPDLVRSLLGQRRLFDGVPNGRNISFVALDFTRPNAGYDPKTYGLSALIAAVRETAPVSLATSLRDAARAANAKIAAGLESKIVMHATAAAAADVVPLAGVIAVPGIQASMLREVAAAYGISWDGQTVAQFATCLGTGVAIRMLSTFGIRELVKLIPVYGQTVGTAAAAASSFATTFAVGKAAVLFLSQRRLGEADPKAVAQIYGQSLRNAFDLSRAPRPSVSKTG